MKTRWVVATLVLAYTLWAGSAVAQTTASALPIDKDAIPDVRVIIDISGSMKLNDPQNLRRPALELLVQLFPEGAKAGVWTFGQWVNMLVAHKPVTSQWRKDALSKAQKINSVALHTNIPEVIDKAMDDIDRLDPGYHTSLILLTDGMVDVSKSPKENSRARQHIIDDIIPRLRAAGVTVHTVALSKNADKELMERLAIETNGLAAVAESADDLTRIFLQAFDAAIPAEQVPLEGNGFVVDSSIEEYTALVFRKEGSEESVLVSPDGKRYNYTNNSMDIEWFRKDNYDLITVKRPYEGQWSIIADLEPNSRVTIVSNLSLQVSSLAKSAFVGTPASISAVLMEQGANVTKPELLDLVDMSVEIKRRHDNYRKTLSLDTAASDGVYTSLLDILQETGVYDITVRANGKTFQRQRRQTVEVRESFATSVSSTDENPPDHNVTLSAINPAIDLTRLKIVAHIEQPDGNNETRQLQPVSTRQWVLPIEGLNRPGMYRVSFNVTGEYQDSRSLSYQSAVVEIEHRVPGLPFVAQPEVEAEPEPKPQPKLEAKSEPEPQPEPEPVEQEAEQEEAIDWKKMALYAGIVIGNLLVFLLGYFAYRMVTSKSSSDILDSSDDTEEDGNSTADTDTGSSTEEVVTESENTEQEPDTDVLDNEEADDIDVDQDDSDLDEIDADDEEEVDEEEASDDPLDLPDDAIDIDPGTDAEEEKP